MINRISFRRPAKIFFIACLSFLAIWIGSIALISGLLLHRLNRVRQMADDLPHIQLANLAVEVHGARQQFSVLHAELAPLLWITSQFHGDLGAVKPLADAGSEMLVAGDEILSTLKPSLGSVDIASLSMAQLPGILDALADARPDLAAAYLHVDSASAALAHIEGPLSSQMEHWSSLVNQAVQLARLGLQGLQIGPGLLGQAGPRTYLLLLENPDEMRATGGFISAVGLMKIDNGKLVDISVQDSYAVEDFSKWHPDPPQPLFDYMLAEQWVVRDANWSPDFPTSAQDAIRLYQISNPKQKQIDGVIGLTSEGVKMFIASLGPLNVTGLPEPVTASNFNKILEDTWNPPPDTGNFKAWFTTRKQAIGLVMTAAMDKILHGEADWPQLAQGVVKAFSQRQLMFYTYSEAGELKKMQWDGSLRSSIGDYLMVVDSNVGFNKANPLVSEKVNYRVTLQSDGTGHAVTEIDYVHQGKQTGIVCKHYIQLGTKVTYDILRQTCYYDYLRIIAPSGSRLLQATPQAVSPDYLLPGVSAPGKAETFQDDLLGRTVLSEFFVLEYGKQLQVHFEYDLPKVVNDLHLQKQYTLIVQKQGGTGAIPVGVELTLPPGASLVSSDPLPISSSGGSLKFDLRLDVDRQINVIYSLVPGSENP